MSQRRTAARPGGGTAACNRAKSASLPRQQPRFDQRRADHRLAAGQPARLLGRAHAMAEDQADVEHVAQQPLGQAGPRGRRRPGDAGSSGRRRCRGPRRGVRSRRGPPARSATTSPSGPPRPDRPAPPRSGPAATSSRRSVSAAHSSTPEQPACVAALKLLVPLGQPLLGSQHVGAEGGHGVGG